MELLREQPSLPYELRNEQASDNIHFKRDGAAISERDIPCLNGNARKYSASARNQVEGCTVLRNAETKE